MALINFVGPFKPIMCGLADTIMPVIGCIDGITEDLHSLVTRDNELLDLSAHRNSKPVEERMRDTNAKRKELAQLQFEKEIMHA